MAMVTLLIALSIISAVATADAAAQAWVTTRYTTHVPLDTLMEDE